MHSSLARSYGYCESLARREAGNFYHGFRVLPRGQRLAMCALYAFMRIADDRSDEAGSIEEKRRRLADWRHGLNEAMAGRHSHRLHEALHDTIRTYAIPAEYLHDVLDGVEMDLEPVAYETFAELQLYCYRVASAVGLACIHIWGFADARAERFAESAGIAFQLTNILRDLREDAARDRVYLPREDLERFGYNAAGFSACIRDDRFRALMRFEIDRARGFYDAARPLVPLLSPPGRAVFLVMARTYRGLLDAIERRDYDVFSSRVRVSSWRKLMFALRALPVRWGLLAG
jgi:phytoene synthase